MTHGHRELEQTVALAIGVLLLSTKRYAGHLGRLTGRRTRPRRAASMQAAARVVLFAGHRQPSAGWIVVPLIAFCCAVTLWQSLPIDARRTAYCARNNPDEAVRFIHTHRTLPLLRHIPVLRVRTDPASIIWTGGGSAAELPSPLGEKPPERFPSHAPLIYLGNAGGRVFVYVKEDCKTLQVAESSVALVTKPAAHCHWWKGRKYGSKVADSELRKPCG